MRGPVLLVLSLAITGCAHAPKAQPTQPASQGPFTPAEIAARALPAVVTMRTAQSLGTGFVVRADGWIATNLHVVVGGPRVKVTLRDGRELEVVEVLNASTDYDLALVRVEAKGLPTLTLGDSDAMRPGDPVVAIGNPMGLEDTVSNGLVSGRRKVEGGLEILQVSAPIAPGSSGGPLINERGEVIGIATLVLQQGQNLNFGVPIRYLIPMMKQPDPMPFKEFAALVDQMRAQARAARHAKTRDTVPHHPLTILDGCSQDAQKLVVKALGDAIGVGAPLYNDGNPDACYRVYDGAASNLERKLPPACKGPIKALADAQKRAGATGDPDKAAWAMRDAFDGLLEVIARKQEQ
ncbi:MAG TPA: trypsin-like peptidase domain-containing protein [Polyangiaceae bacterium]